MRISFAHAALLLPKAAGTRFWYTNKSHSEYRLRVSTGRVGLPSLPLLLHHVLGYATTLFVSSAE